MRYFASYKNALLMFKKSNFLFIVMFCIMSISCVEKPYADLIITNGNIFTVEKDNHVAEAIAVKDDRIIAIGSSTEIDKFLHEKTKVINAEGHFIMPGFIEGHGHFSALGKSLQSLNFLNSKSWQDIVNMVENEVKITAPGEWITGGGWHQEKWFESPGETVLGFPLHHELSRISPDNPVLLNHASGHALFANAKAMELAGVQAETANPMGGEIIRDASGQAIGVFQENAEQIIYNVYKEYLKSMDENELNRIWLEGIQLAQQECLSKGITSFQDAGSSYATIQSYMSLADSKKLDIRLWVMLRQSYNQMKDVVKDARVINYANHFFTCRAIKSELDGALGSYGAWLLEPYNDDPKRIGQNTTEVSTVDSIAQLSLEHQMQLCVHAIGDKANRETINVYEKYLNSSSNKDLRWRVEHAQHLNPLDIPRFAEHGIIASMQGIHCTSDAPFVVDRLGEKRAREGAYAWRSLLDNGVTIANGTDAPVEDVDPLASFYASVSRKRTDMDLEFYPEQKMTRIEAIYSYTLGNAFAAFEEKDKGSLAEGKLADIVILSKDLVRCTNDEILQTEVLYTIVGGKVKYKKD